MLCFCVEIKVLLFGIMLHFAFPAKFHKSYFCALANEHIYQQNDDISERRGKGNLRPFQNQTEEEPKRQCDDAAQKNDSDLSEYLAHMHTYVTQFTTRPQKR